MPLLSESTTQSAGPRRSKARISDAATATYELLETRRLFAAIPAPLTDTDIGTPTGGSASFNAGTFNVVGAGSDIFGGSDAFNFVHQSLHGDGTVTVRVSSITANGANSVAGLDIRSSTNPNSPTFFIGQRDDGSIFVNDRRLAGDIGGNVINNVAARSRNTCASAGWATR